MGSAVILDFPREFANAVSSGRRTQTIRRHRKRPFRRGDILGLYMYWMTDHPHRLRHDVICTEVHHVEIHRNGVKMMSRGNWMNEQQLNRFVEREGFGTWDGFYAWFSKWHLIPFDGVLVRWNVKQKNGRHN